MSEFYHKSTDPDSETPETDGRLTAGSCLRIVVTIAAIFSLLGTVGGGAYWLLLARNQRFLRPANMEETAAAGPPATALAPAIVDETLDPVTQSINRIVYVNASHQVETIRPDGMDVHRISTGQRRYHFPVWSPDGRFLAAVGQSDAESSVIIFPDRDGAPANVLFASSDQHPFYLFWSPDSQMISFLASHPLDSIGLHLTPIAPGATSRLLATGSPFYWDWSIEGTRLLAHVGSSPDDAWLSFLNADGAREEEFANPGFFQAPVISADGRFRAYARIAAGGGGRQVVIEDTETGTRHGVPHEGFVAMGWSPTADELAFINNSSGESNFHGPLQLVDGHSGSVRPLLSEQVIAFFWSPDGRTIAYFNFVERIDGINAATEPRTRDRQRSLSKPMMQANRLLNLSLLEVKTGKVRHLSTFETTDLFQFQFLPFFDQYALSHRIWSPAGDALVVPQLLQGVPHIVVVSAHSGQSLPVAQGSIAFWSQQ